MQSGISGNLLKWFQNYLDGGEEKVVNNGSNPYWLQRTTVLLIPP
jgi:hypothetical protein